MEKRRTEITIPCLSLLQYLKYYNVAIMVWRVGLSAHLSKFAHGTKMNGVADTREDRIRIQNDPDKPETWFEINQMKFNRDK